jgi:cytochrome b
MSVLGSGMDSERQVWDLPVRLCHWTLVAAVAGAWLTHALGINYFVYHVWCGYAVLVLVTFRIVWGIVGTRHARFWNFLRAPRPTARYGWDLLRGRVTHYAGHNPLGAWMVLLLLLALFAQALLGLFGNDEIYNLGPLNGYVSYDRGIELTSLHRRLFYWIVAAITLHVAAILYHRIAHKEHLVRAMITGRKSAAVVPDSETIPSSQIVAAVLIVIALAGVLVWVVQHAPAAQNFDSFN